jgi:transposase-like protein
MVTERMAKRGVNVSYATLGHEVGGYQEGKRERERERRGEN